MPGHQESEHPSGAIPAGEYAPGGRLVQPVGSRGMSVVRENIIPAPPPERRAVADRRAREAAQAQQPRRRGRPVGSRNRDPIPQEFFDAPPDEG